MNERKSTDRNNGRRILRLFQRHRIKFAEAERGGAGKHFISVGNLKPWLILFRKITSYTAFGGHYRDCQARRSILERMASRQSYDRTSEGQKLRSRSVLQRHSTSAEDELKFRSIRTANPSQPINSNPWRYAHRTMVVQHKVKVSNEQQSWALLLSDVPMQIDSLRTCLQLTLAVPVSNILQLPLRCPGAQLRMIRALFPDVPALLFPTPCPVLLVTVRLPIENV